MGNISSLDTSYSLFQLHTENRFRRCSLIITLYVYFRAAFFCMKYKEILLMRHLINEHVLLISETFWYFPLLKRKLLNAGVFGLLFFGFKKEKFYYSSL